MNRFNTDYPQLESMIDGDISTACADCDKKYGLEMDVTNLSINPVDYEYDTSTTYEVTATLSCEGEEFEVSFEVLDDVDSDMYEYPEITMYDLHDAYMHRYYMSMNQKYDAQDFEDRLKSRGNVSVKSATSIMAADDDDPFADMGFDDPDEGDESGTDLTPSDDPDDVSDRIDEMSDTLDDLNDALQDFEEDDIDIETENNIEDHYIAECEKCHGVFITSVIESDQEIEKISGTCPLCDEDCDQYLKWIIKEL